MKNNFEKEFKQMMGEEKEIPLKVRQSLDQSYDIIRVKSKKKKAKFIWKRVAAAACALIATGVVLTNEHVMASINEFFNFGDKGIDRAISEGFVQENNSKAADQKINITLERHFSDTNKIGMSFQLVFEDPSVLNNVEEFHIDYRLKNGDGEYIEEFIPDTKPLKGNNQYISSLNFQTPILDTETGRVQFDVLMASHKGNIPALKDAVVEVESINLFYGFGEIKKIDGEWALLVNNQTREKENSTIQYVMQDGASIIQVFAANASPTSFNLTFSLDGIYENENIFAHRMKIIDENGNEFAADSGFSMEKKNNNTIISTNFPLTSYSNSNKLKFILEEIGEVELYKK